MSHRLRNLGGAVLVAAIVGAIWLAWVTHYAHTPTLVLPTGASATDSDGATFKLTHLRATPKATDKYGQELAALPNAVLIIATVSYDASGVSNPDFTCSFRLRAGEIQWSPDESRFTPPPPEVAFCEPGQVGTITTLFQVPSSVLNQVDGLIVVDSSGPLQVLAGQAR